jgi:DNA-binding MarR family transcriptional regulator
VARASSSIQAEIRQRRPFPSLAQAAVVALARTSDLMRRRLAEVVEGGRLTPQQYNVLRILRGAGEDGLPTLEIAERMIEHAPGVTRLLDRLEAKRLVRRARCPRDRRQVLCWITPAGVQLVGSLDGPMEQGARAFMRPLGAREITTLLRLLDALRAARSPDSRSTGPSPVAKGDDR